jgi:dTDP-4-dehydrorhamnose reductase
MNSSRICANINLCHTGLLSHTSTQYVFDGLNAESKNDTHSKDPFSKKIQTFC